MTTGPSASSTKSEGATSRSAAFLAPPRSPPVPRSGLKPATEDPVERLLQPAREWLEPSERHRTLRELEPSSKREALLLLAFLLEGQPPTADLDIYFDFGFVVCKTEDETMILAGLYKALLTKPGEKVDMFYQVWRALADNTLVELFDDNGYPTFRDEIPALERFLSASPGRRPTVWRLIQFIRQQENTDPSAWLQRDYGFQFCKQREEVERLKNIYSAILKKSSPGQLHRACIQGQLFQFGLSKGVVIDPRNKRLMQNTRGHPSLGYDDEETAKLYKGPFFRKSK
ncbi:hypothetical protein K491DRAFT_589746 [Lophiostoma macrostomum CBS 122681]|uniref:Uncharacterized protein n=1 Tax=Lophiostoma macrostomum CBS 122681 TaxID=1314788 RepID=A0A6A6TJE4_9PLEO|nr:hypothetical protein K491DRAFT_589746 [Lophiostoma macrostomum CBS 122681]